MLFTLDRFSAVLGARGPDGRPYLLIGGQAVYYWASRYVGEEPLLEQWRPFTSKDIDFQGGLQDLRWLAKEAEIAASGHAAAVRLREKRLPSWRSKVKSSLPDSSH